MKTKILAAFLLSALYCASVARGQTLEWIQLLGTSEDDFCSGVSADGLGNVYISGYTGGSLGGTNEGSSAAFVAKFSVELPMPDADFDADGDVDGEDFLIWQSSFRIDDRGDADGDGNTDGDDLFTWQQEFGTGTGSGPVAAAVPELSTWLLALIGVAFCCFPWNRRPNVASFPTVAGRRRGVPVHGIAAEQVTRASTVKESMKGDAD